MSRTIFSAERRRLEDAAREYESRGYRVILDPAPHDLPDFLMGLRPDLLAYSDQENVVIEAKSGTALAQSPEIVALANAIKAQPGWRFELVVTGSRSSEDFTGLDIWEIRQRLADARELLIGNEAAATILVWSAAEAAMRLIAHANMVALRKEQRESPLHMAKQLFSVGLLSDEDYGVLQRGASLRNLLVHGYRTPQIERESVRDLIASVEHLLSEEMSQRTA